MKVQFSYSENKEKEKLLNIYDKYQWFIDNDFPVVLPDFYAEIYRESEDDKEVFAKVIDKELSKLYSGKSYQLKKEEVENNWRKIEREFFDVLNNFNLNVGNRYVCYISLYGPEGQFKYPDVVNLRVGSDADIENANETIAHELIHLMIYDRIEKLKLDYKQTEGVVDLFFTETDLKEIFPDYRLQSIAVHDKSIFRRIK